MSTAAGAPSNGASVGATSPESKNKGKEKSTATSSKVSMEEEDEEDDDEGDEEMASDEGEEEEEDSLEEIDPSAILSSTRRTRGVKVDYTSKEALEKAGLQDERDEDSDDDVEMKD